MHLLRLVRVHHQILALCNYAGHDCIWFYPFLSCLQPSINTTNIDTLLVATDQTERIVEPPDNVQEKIAFIFNNLSQSNMTQKVQEADTAWLRFRLGHSGSILKASPFLPGGGVEGDGER